MAAQAAGVGVRALQKAFRECLDTTPGAWLLQLRLRRARAALLAADDGTSVTSVAHDNGLDHLGRFARHYGEAFGEAPSETLKASLKLRAAQKRGTHPAISTGSGQGTAAGHGHPRPSSDKKAMVSIECGQIIVESSDIFAAFDRVHDILRRRQHYKRGAVILKRGLEGSALVYSHYRGGMDDARFRVDMNRVNSVLTSARGIVHSVLQKGDSRIENDLDLVTDYAALDASTRSELCVPLIIGGDVVGAINFESDIKNAFDLHDVALASALSFATVGQLETERRSGGLGLSGFI
nr:helix-turn-helix domain-containing protein [Roseibaca sp. Y0-43]